MKAERIIDLTQPFYHNCPGPPLFPLPQVEITNIAPRDNFNMERLTFVTHTGTHIDAPYHFIENGKRLDEIDILSLQGKGVIVDLFDKGPDEGITENDLQKYDERIDEESIVLLATGWGLKRGFNDEYLYHPPRLTVDGAKYLVKKRVKGVGIDHFSLSGVEFEKAVPPHIEILRNDIWILEDLLLPVELLEEEEWYIIALPMLLKGGSGGPVRVAAIVFQPIKLPDSNPNTAQRKKKFGGC